MGSSRGGADRRRHHDDVLATEFGALHRELIDQYQPQGAVEAELVDGIAADFWRRRRAASLETALFDREDGRAGTIERLVPAAAIERDIGYGQRLYHAFVYANNTGADFAKLARYLAVIDASLHRNLQTLARLQAGRGRRGGEDTVEMAAVATVMSG